MSEDDRAAKAARAKALLKKRQQKKATDSINSVGASGVASPGGPSRTSTPAPAEPVVEQDGRELGDVFETNKDSSDTSWLTSLPRVEVASPPPPPPLNGSPTNIRRVSINSPLAATISPESPPIITSSPNINALQNKLDTLFKENESLTAEVTRLQSFEAAAQQAEESLIAERKHVEELEQNYKKLQEDSEIAIQNEHRTVSLLVAEKAHLTSELQKLEGYESRVQELEELLETERNKSGTLEGQVSQLEAQINSIQIRAERAEAQEREISERYKEKERELQLATSSITELRKDADESQRKLRELEEQIQSDDRVERLEKSLQHTQDRADELEFQLSKLKQTHTALKGEKDLLQGKVSTLSTTESELQSQITTLEASLVETREKLAKAEEERTDASHEASKLQDLSQSLEVSVKDHQERLGQAAAALATSTRQIQTTQNELKAAIRRTEDAERIQQSLQAEGTTLMQSLNEMRPKIVELTGSKLALAEKVESLEHTLRSRDSFISQLENDLGEARDQAEQAENSWKEKLAEQEKRHRDIQNGTTDVQKAYAELQEEMETTLASLRNLEAQRTNQHQEASRRLEEIERFKNLSQSQGEELDNLRKELEARTKARDEEQDFLERAQNEIETLRAELSAREDEIEDLREIVNSPASEAPRSLDDEMLSSIRQQHAIEISAATSQVRALENTIFDKETAIHKLQKHVSSLEEQISQLRSTSASRLGQHRGSPVPPASRPASRAHDNNDLRRASFGSHRTPQPPLARTIFDQNMSAETMHKRKVSLSMLKARIESEAKQPSQQPPSRALSPVHSETNNSRPASSMSHRHQPHGLRSQFLDESHVFWCHSCQGDLVIL